MSDEATRSAAAPPSAPAAGDSSSATAAAAAAAAPSPAPSPSPHASPSSPARPAGKKERAVLRDSDSDSDGKEEEEEAEEEEMKKGKDKTKVKGASPSSSSSSAASGSSSGSSSSTSSGTRARRRKRLRAKEDDARLDEDDYALIKENVGVSVASDDEADGKRFKRLKATRKAKEDDGGHGGDGGHGDDGEASPRAASSATAQRKDKDKDGSAAAAARDGAHDDEVDQMERDMFGDDDLDDEDAPAAAPAAATAAPALTEGLSDSEDDLDQFIVDGDDGPGGAAQARRPRRRAAGEDEENAYLMDEAHDLFGDGSLMDLQRLREELEADTYELEDMTKKDADADKGTSLRERFDPDQLDEHHIGEEFQVVRMTDRPERYQLMYGDRDLESACTEQALRSETVWIFHRRFLNRIKISTMHGPERDELSERTRTKIYNVLTFILKEQVEVPFIARYKKDYYMPELDEDDLWAIVDEDLDWYDLQQRQAAMDKMLDNAQDKLPAEVLFAYREFVEKNRDSTIEVVKDVMARVTLDLERIEGEADVDANGTATDANAGAGEAEAASKGKPRPSRRQLLKRARAGGLYEFLDKWTLPAFRVGENVDSGYEKTPVSDPDRMPEDLATEYISAAFTTTEVVMRIAKVVAAEELAHEPAVRALVRSTYPIDVEVAVDATRQRRKDLLDATHPYRDLRRKRPPPEYFEQNPGDYLRMCKAQDEGFVKISINLSDSGRTEVRRNLERYYTSIGTNALSYAWNQERMEVIDLALSQFILPQLAKEHAGNLRRNAARAVAASCAKQLHDIVFRQPFARADKRLLNRDLDAPAPMETSDDDDEEDDGDLRVCAISMGANQTATVAFLDGNGDVVDFCVFHFLRIRTGDNAQSADYKRKMAETKELKARMMSLKPDLVAVATSSMEGKTFFELIRSHCADVSQEARHIITAIPVSPATGIVYREASFSAKEFPDYDPVLRETISLARRMRDPISELARLFNRDEDILSLKYELAQDLVPTDERMKAYERVFVDVVNKVGVDLQRVMRHEHLDATLQFVAGLGARKARHILSSLRRKNTVIESRAKLFEHKFISGPNIFKNCAGFLRIAGGLDESRVHPADYDIAHKMAVDALEVVDIQQSKVNEYVERIRSDPRKLDDLDLDAYAVHLEREQGVRKKMTLYDIKSEMEMPFKDIRLPFRDLTPDELFTLLTGETDETLRVDMLVQAEVISVRDTSVRCRLDSGITGWIKIHNLSDSHVEFCDDVNIKKGSVVTCRVLEINKDRTSVELSCRTSDLKPRSWEIDSEDERERAAKAKRERRGLEYMRRDIVHPNFRNWALRECTSYLRDQDTGEAIIRPSSKAHDHLTLSWSFVKGTILHVDIEEVDKPEPTQIGSSLIIDGRTFEDLDELLDGYVEPIAKLVTEMMEYRKFKSGTQEEVDQALKDEKQAQSAGSIPYAINLCSTTKYQGRFVISYMPSSKVMHEYISVKPDGYRFRQIVHETPDLLTGWFKKHWREIIKARPKPVAEQPAAPAAPAVSTAAAAGANFYYQQAQQAQQYGQQGAYGAPQGAYGAPQGAYGAPQAQQVQQAPPPPAGDVPPPPPEDEQPKVYKPSWATGKSRFG